MRKLRNPFVYLSGETTATVGAVAFLATLAIAGWGDEIFRGVVSMGYGDSSFWRLLVQGIVAWGLFASLLYGAARIASKSKIRAIDLYGNQFFARILFLPLWIIGGIPTFREMLSQLAERLPAQPPISELLLPTAFGVLVLLLLAGFFLWSYRGFSVAANLQGGKSVAIYIGCYVAAEALCALIRI